MTISALASRARNKWRRLLAEKFARRSIPLRQDRAYVSFTFDDCPRSAFVEGGRILRKYGAFGSYYMAMSLSGRETDVGLIASPDDVRTALRNGHEVGCHTYDHLNGAIVDPDEFVASIEANRVAFREVAADYTLASFAYPFDGPRLAVKRAMPERFACCRGGGQTLNEGVVDLALVKSFFIDGRNSGDLAAIEKIIARNTSARGWLVFSTHDISVTPSAYGCRPDVFESVVRMAAESGARVLPVAKVCEEQGVRLPAI